MHCAVIDAGVVLKRYLPDEAHGEHAMYLLNRYIAGYLQLIAPSLLEYELINGLEIARRLSRIPESAIRSALDGFYQLSIPLKPVDRCVSEILHYCNVFQRSAYDAAYLAIAETEKSVFVTADGALHNRVKSTLSWVRWIGDLKIRG